MLNRCSSRRGNALVMTVGITALCVVLILNSSTMLVGLVQQTQVDEGRQQAVIAAESLASLLQDRLSVESANLNYLKTDITANPAGWLNLKGFCPGPFSTNTNGGIYFGNCLLVWRVEPVSIYSASYNPSAGSPMSSQVFLVNSEPNASLETTRSTNAATADSARFPGGGNTLLPTDPMYYHFRIVTQAFALSSPDLETTGTPWVSPTQRICKAQAQRICQLAVLNLFRYALFYAQPGPVGDLELSTGTTLTISGSVFSNGAIFFYGGDSAGVSSNPYNYHSIASGGVAAPGEQVLVGTSASKTTITGVQGIFRLSKYGDELAQANAGGGNPACFATATNPWSVPLDGVSGMTGNVDLNGDTPTTNRHEINGIAFTSSCDSRSPFTASGMKNTFAGAARDENLGATSVTTLSNIPSLAGRPFEAQIFGGSQVLYTTNAAAPNNPAFWTSIPGASTAELYYAVNPSTTNNPGFTTTANGFPASCENLPMYWQNTAKSVADIQPIRLPLGVITPTTWTVTSPSSTPGGTGTPVPGCMPLIPTGLPVQDAQNNAPAVGTAGPYNVAGVVGDLDAGFSPWEEKSYYLELGLYGSSCALPWSAGGTTGLVIRERADQNAGLGNPNYPIYNQGTFSAVGVAPFTSSFSNPFQNSVIYSLTPTAAQVTTYVQYLESQYAVYLGGYNCTNQFFSQIASQSGPANYIATEDEFEDGREDVHMAYWYGINPQKWPNATGQTYRQNVLTLNMGAIMTWLTNTNFSTIDGNLSDATKAYQHFNGVIYVARTRRSTTYDPVVNTTLQFNATGGQGSLSALYTPANLTTAAPTNFPNSWREAAGPYETQRVHVRVRNGSKINWNLNGTTSGTLSSSGLTFVTPDRLYEWGDFNSVTYTDSGDNPALSTVPCAMFADGVVCLSNAWTDQNNFTIANGDIGTNTYSNTQSTQTTIISSLVTCNVPSYAWNAAAGGSGAASNLVRFLEQWNGNPYVFKGSAVVMNAQRYSQGALDYVGMPVNLNTAVYTPPDRQITFNTDLLMQDGQPPFSPFGIQVAQVVGVQNVLDQ